MKSKLQDGHSIQAWRSRSGEEGNFQSLEGDVDRIDEANGRVTVIINIFGRSTPVVLDHWQVESL